MVTGEVGESPWKSLTALSVSVNWSTESFLFVHPQRNTSSSWQYFPLASTIKYHFHRHYLRESVKCAHFPAEFHQSGPSRSTVGAGCLKVWTKLLLIKTFRRGCPPFIVWIFLKLEMDAACQVHVWHVSRAYTIISSSSLSEFIVLNFCPSLNMRWKRGISNLWMDVTRRDSGYLPEFVWHEDG